MRRCTSDDGSSVLDARPSTPVCSAEEAEPMHVRVAVTGAVGTWWTCPQGGRVSTASCDEQR